MSPQRKLSPVRWWIALAALVALLGWWLAGRRTGPNESASGALSAAASAASAPATTERGGPELTAPVRDSDEDAPLASELSAPSVALRSETSDDGTLRVDLVDPLGAPRGGILLWLESTLPMMPGQLAAQSQVSRTDGRVEFAGMRRDVASQRWPWKLRAEIVSERACELVLDAATLALEVVRLELPAGGVLDILVRELDGAPAQEGSPVKLRLAKAPGQVLQASVVERDARTDQGRVRFPWVELGREWEALAWRPHGSSAANVRFARPTTLGEQVEVELVLGAESAVVSYRVLSAELHVLAKTELVREQAGLLGGVDRVAVVTDELGRFTLDARASDLEPDSFVLIHAPEGGPESSAHAKRLTTATAGWHDGGDIVLEPAPVLCAGRVLERDGSPAANATVRLGDGARWHWAPSPRTVDCDERGRFEVRGLWPQDSLNLSATRDGRESQVHSVTPPARDVELVLTHTCIVSGTLLLDDGVDPKLVGFARAQPDGSLVSLEREGRPLLAWLDARADSSAFRLRALEPGPLDLVLLLDEFELTRVEGLRLSGDLELGQIDLRGKLRTLEIELVAPEADAKLEGESFWQLSEGGKPRLVYVSGGSVRWVGPIAPVDVELRVHGYRRARLERLAANARHILQPPLRVRLVLRASDELLEPPLYIEAELHDDVGAVSAPAGARYFTAERDALELSVGAPGSFRVRWRLERHFEGDGFGGASAMHVLEEHSVTLEVGDTPGVQEFVLELPPGALASLVGALK